MDKTKMTIDLLQQNEHGILSTYSRALEGYPFGSLVSYVLFENKILMLLSDLAEHTTNIKNNSKVSLTVLEKSDYPDNSGRVTWIGNAFQDNSLKETFLKLRPSSSMFLSMHDFNVYVIDPLRIRYIGGFGKIFWVEPNDLPV